jgi:choline-sulfatase
MDRLAAEGVRFERVYTPCPLCQPARASLWTSRLPHETGVVSNEGGQAVPPDMPTLGDAFAAAGYETVHFGKMHDGGALRGFRCEPIGTLPVEAEPAWPLNDDTFHDRYTTVRCVEYLRAGPPRPFFMVADLVNPHNICGWIGENKGPHEDVPVTAPLPPLPPNFETEDLARRPRPIQYLCCGHRRLAHASQWTEANYRHYLAAYHHYAARVDAEVSLILRALDALPAAANTLIVLLSDHGEGMAAHRMVTKNASFYEEVVRVPLIFRGPGVAGRGRAVRGPLVTLLDLAPTLCTYAGLKAPEGMRGRSLLGALARKAPKAGHPYVAGEWQTEFGFVITPGRMIRTSRYKYTRYLEGGGEELFDLRADPGETRSLAGDPAAAHALQDQRRLLEKHLTRTGDPFLDLAVKVDERWRSHPVGYPNHRGLSAIEVGKMQQASKV